MQTISHKCEVLRVADFTKKFGGDTRNYTAIYDNNDTYYLAGHYDPTALTITMQPNIPTAAAAVVVTTTTTSTNASSVRMD